MSRELNGRLLLAGPLIHTLLIEDDPDDALLVREALAESRPGRFRLDHVERLEAGLTRLESGGVHLVLLDLSLPDSRGLDTLRRVVEQSPWVPIVVMTDRDDDQAALQALREGGQDYLVKGRIHADSLARALSLAVERKQVDERQRDGRAALARRASERTTEIDRLRRELTRLQGTLPADGPAPDEPPASPADRLAAAIVATVREPLLVLDGSLRVRMVNRAFGRTFAVEPDEVEGRPLPEIVEGQWDIPTLRLVLEQVIPRDLEFHDFEVEHDFPRIGRRAMLLNARRIDPEEGREPLILLAIEDVTERRRAERALARLAEGLRQSNRELEQFATVASHDLQEPLRKIRTFGDRLAETCGDALGEQGRGYLARMTDAAARMQALIDDLLTLARVATAGGPFEPVDLSLVAAEVARDLEAQAERTGGRIEFGPLPTLEACPAQMRQLFQNLLSNALKFHRPGEPPRVSVRAEPPGRLGNPEAYRIAFEDDGIGFDPRYSGKIFEAFERLHGRSAYEGTGIGLAICRRIAERHGGTIEARGVPGRGATFAVTLPARQS